MATKKQTKKKIERPPIPPEDLVTPNFASWCKCFKGYLQCGHCGSKIRVGGTMVDKEGKEKKRAYAPWKWWMKHSKCGGT